MNILIIDDHALFRTGLRQLLARLDAEVNIVEAATCREALEQATNELDLILLDLTMPDMNGFEVMDRLAELAPLTPLAIISASEDNWDIKRAMDEGAMGFISKTESEDVILNAVRLIISGGVYLPPAMLHVTDQSTGIHHSEPTDNLTPRQHDVLKLISKGKSNKEIARILDLSEATVKSHVSALFKSCDAHNRTELIVIARKLGLS